MNKQMLKKIVSVFLKNDPQEINDNTVIDNSAIRGSVLFHRMISRINDYYDVELEHYEKIKTFSDLSNELDSKIQKK
tara:strand:- start:171 stop:401 length:231 start_codon:yes stop_codon:yes gene_type:complete